MAVTKIKPIKNTINKSIDYIINPKKTDECKFIYSENCFLPTAATEFEIYLSRARDGGKVLGRHLIQSFKPGETTPEQAHEIGRKLAHEILGGQYAYILATHVDREHIHNHFVICAANLQTNKRYISNKTSYREIRETSDKICKDYGLSIVENPKSYGKQYNVYLEEKRKRYALKKSVDKIISKSKTGEDFMKAVKASGFKLKEINTLGYEYSNAAISQRIKDNGSILKKLVKYNENKKTNNPYGYEQWLTIENLKRSAKNLMFMQDYGLTLGNIDNKCKEAEQKLAKLKAGLKETERSIKSAKSEDLPELYDLLNEQSLQFYIAKREKNQFETVRSNLRCEEYSKSVTTMKFERSLSRKQER